MNYCNYYQAHVVPIYCWYVAAILRSHEHVSFDRSWDTTQSIFEFFVPQSMEPIFLDVMQHFIQKGYVQNLQQLPNRLENPKEKI